LRIGRTGRQGGNGLATTYINKNLDEAILRDLKHLLIESGQKVPNLLNIIQEDENEGQECSFCGGLGHNLDQCHKYEIQLMKSLTAKNNVNNKNKEK
jgi:ATP-dependent RNA helicase DDX41